MVFQDAWTSSTDERQYFPDLISAFPTPPSIRPTTLKSWVPSVNLDVSMVSRPQPQACPPGRTFWHRNNQVVIFSHTDLRMVVSKAKFDAGVDYEVRVAVAHEKTGTRNFVDPKILSNHLCPASIFSVLESSETLFGHVSCRGWDLSDAK